MRYGCCPDGVSPATGAKNKGCPDSRCNESLFGCCPDGVTTAEGNDYEGCKKPCEETELVPYFLLYDLALAREAFLPCLYAYNQLVAFPFDNFN